VAVSATIVNANDGLRSLMPEARNCFFPNENANLKMHKNYSQSNCLFECYFFSAQVSISSTFYEQLLHAQIPKAQKRQTA